VDIGQGAWVSTSPPGYVTASGSNSGAYVLFLQEQIKDIIIRPVFQPLGWKEGSGAIPV
jgi:hypothetical protein